MEVNVPINAIFTRIYPMLHIQLAMPTETIGEYFS